MALPATDCYGEPLKAEIEAGRVPLEVVDTAVRRVLRLKFRLGLFEHPYVDAEAAPAVFQTPEQRALARRAAAESCILLTNDGTLPLSPAVKRVAIIGPGADDARLLQGDYHYPAHLEIIYAARQDVEVAGMNIPQARGNYAPGPYYTPHVTPLAGLRAALGKNVEVCYAKGCEVLGDDCSGFAEAEQAARDADVAIVVVAGRSGLLRPATSGEGSDATSLDLTGVQQQLVETIASTGKPLVVVVLSGRVHTLAEVAARPTALLQPFPPRDGRGTGLADILTGKESPSGRLPVSLPPSSPGGKSWSSALALAATSASVWTRPLSTTTTSGFPVLAIASTSCCCTPVRSRLVASLPSPDVAGRRRPLRPATTTIATSASRAACSASAKPEQSSPSTSQPFA